MSVTSRLDALQRRHRGLGFPIAVVYKYIDDGGGYLAALLTYYAFLSLFPLLLLAATLLGVVLGNDPAAQQEILGTALAQFPVIGRQLQDPSRLGGGVTGLVIGTVTALYGGLGVAMALQNAMNTVWRVPVNRRPNPLTGRLRGLLLLGAVGVALIATTGLSALGRGVGSLGAGVRVAVAAGSVLVNVAVFLLAYQLGTTRRLGLRQVAPGALGAAAVWQLLQWFGAGYVQNVVSRASEVNSVFAVVLGLIAFLYVAAVAIVMCAEVNVVLVDRLWPRALLTPLTDDVDLTAADEQAYTAQAKAQRTKGFEQIDVTFDKKSAQRLAVAGRSTAPPLRQDAAVPDQQVDDYEIDDDPSRIDADAAWRFLSTSAYWGRWRSREVFGTQLAGAWRLVGAYDRHGSMVGFARAVSDGVAMAYLADVYVLPEHRGRGLGAALVRTMIEQGPGAGFRWMLHTSDAQKLYARFGFRPPDGTFLERPSEHLLRSTPDPDR